MQEGGPSGVEIKRLVPITIAWYLAAIMVALKDEASHGKMEGSQGGGKKALLP